MWFMTDPRQILESSATILLVDWPNTGVPRALLRAGLTVFGYSPNRFSLAQVVAHRPDDLEANRIFPPERTGEEGYLVFRPLDARPLHIDLVNTYRPAIELPAIVENLVLPLGAKARAYASNLAKIAVTTEDFLQKSRVQCSQQAFAR
jgi:hypothetical protein